MVKPTKENKDEGRQVIQDTILHIIKDSFKGAATLDQIEATGQKIKALASGRYRAVASSEFVQKDGKVLPQVSERGFKIGINYTLKRGVPHWSVRRFPTEAEAVAKKMNVSLPASASQSVFKNIQPRSDDVACPMCAQEGAS